MRVVFKISLLLVVCLAILAVVDYFVPDSSFFQDYIRGSFTKILGIIVTLLLIENILERNRRKELNEIAKKAFARSIEMIQIPLDNYNLAAFEIATPLTDETYKDRKPLKKGFPFKNLASLYELNANMVDGFNKPKVEIYFEKLDRLIATVTTTLYQVDLSNYPLFSEFLLGFIKEIEGYYPKQGILGFSSNAVVTSEIKKMIFEHEGELRYEHSNLLNNYVRLYGILQFMIDFDAKFSSFKQQTT